MEDAGRQYRVGAAEQYPVSQVLQIAHAPRGNARHTDRIAAGAGHAQVIAALDAILVHAGQQDFTGAEAFHLLCPLDGIEPGGLAPAMGEDFPAGRFAGGGHPLGVDRHDDARRAEALGRLADELGSEYRCGVDRHLVGAGVKQVADVLHGAHTAAHGQRDEHLAGHALDGMQGGVTALMGGGDVEEGDLVGTLLVVAPGNLYRVPGITDVLEFHPFDDAAIFHVEAGDDAFGEAHGRLQVRVSDDHRGAGPLLLLRGPVAQRLGFGHVQRAFVDGAAGDGADDAGGIGIEQALDVAQIMDAAGGDHRDRGGVGQGSGGFHIAALHHAVLGNVGIDNRGDAIGLEALGQVDDLQLADLGPAVGGDEAILGIQADDDLAGEGAAGFTDKLRLLDRLGADDHVTHAGAHVMLDSLQRTDAAADLDRQVGVAFGNGRHYFAIDRLTFEGAVQVHQVQPAATGFNPPGSHGYRVVGEHRGIVHQPLAQTHAGAILEVNSGDNQHRNLPDSM